MTQTFDDPQWLAPPRTVRESFADGSFVLRSPEPLQPYARCIGEWLEHWAAETPDAPAFAERDANGEWRRLSWAQTREQVGRIAQGLIDLKLTPGAPIVVLSDNAIDHLLLMLAGMHIGTAVCTVSSAYCRLTQDHSKIHGILNTLAPALVYASDAKVYGPALASAGLGAVKVFSQGAETIAGALSFAQLSREPEGPAVMQAFMAITPDTHAKYLLTSGSTGHPKVVINTHRMLCANQQMIAQVWRFLEHEKPIIVDWLPWSHTFGGNHNLNLVLRNGGTLVIDEGRPAPGLVEKSLRNLCEVQPTLYFNVPRGFDMLLPLLEADLPAAQRFFERLRMVFYAGAALPQATWERFQALARRVQGQEVWLTTSWGATETSPAITSAHWKLERAGVIGLPLPGMELKFVPVGAVDCSGTSSSTGIGTGTRSGAGGRAESDTKLELRVRGVSVFPGYRNAPELSAQAFDADGYYRIGDAGLLLDDAAPERGVVFNGRVAEDFKLSSGTWVSVGTLRIRVVSALAPWAQDVVVTGHDRDEVGVLVFPTAAAAALPAAELAQHVAAALSAMKSEGGGSSQLPTCVLVLREPPSVDTGEITDKGYINQAAVRQRRAAEVQALYADGPDVIRATAAPDLDTIRRQRARLGARILTTPIRLLADDAVGRAVGANTQVWLKEELFQRTGTFKPRGGLSVMLDLDASALARGVTGVSAGNHAISLAWCARELGTTAKVVMPRNANPFRVDLCRELGAQVVLVDNVHLAFEHVKTIERDEGRIFVHPFEGPKTVLGNATLGLEFIEQVRAAGTELDAVVVAAGGGGLPAGVACAVKQLSPATAVFVVEPEGADTLHRSLKAGSPQAITAVNTIADSLGSPRCEPYSFALNLRYVDEVVLVSDDQIRQAMRLLFHSAKLAVEPAGAAALAALMYPLRARLDGQRVGLVVCGANVDAQTFARHVTFSAG